MKTTSLQRLVLAKNRLTTDVYRSLNAVTSLTSLTLNNNYLQDSCGGASDTVRGTQSKLSVELYDSFKKI